MSAVQVQGNSGGTGTVTVASPNTNSNFTVTLPAVAGTLALTTNIIGVSQTWQSVSGSRALGTTYTNSTGKPIAVSVQVQSTTAGTNTIVIGGVTVVQTSTAASLGTAMFAIVPDGATYVVDNNQASKSIIIWTELR
jgi:hypothetical protein